jgi:hypothetical protein
MCKLLDLLYFKDVYNVEYDNEYEFDIKADFVAIKDEENWTCLYIPSDKKCFLNVSHLKMSAKLKNTTQQIGILLF